MHNYITVVKSHGRTAQSLGEVPESNGEETDGLPQPVAVLRHSLHFISELLDSGVEEGCYQVGVHGSKHKGNESRGIMKLRTIDDKPVYIKRNIKGCCGDKNKTPLISVPLIQM